MEEEINKRKEKVLDFLKQPTVWVLGFLIIALILGVYIRSIPMHIRPETGKPGLWDITTDTWTLGPDLDPWLFLRSAKEIVDTGSIAQIDVMRNVPLGFDTTKETRLLPYMITTTYWILNIFSNVNIEYAGVIFPVIMFTFTILVFFLFVREIFITKNKNSKIKANIISLISTFFMIVIPSLLSRTLAGIPEKESAGFCFLFLAFYLFLKAWKSENWKFASFFAIIAGISTATMGLIWGGVNYIFVTIAVSTFLAFLLNKIDKKETLIYSLWLVFSWAVMLIFSNRFDLKGFIVSLDTGLAFLILFILIVHLILWKTKISKLKILRNCKLPKNITSLIISIILGVLLVSVLFGPNFIIEKITDLNQILFKPTTGRWNTTVAENRQPYFLEWGASFGPFIPNVKNSAILFWLFFVGSVVLFKQMLKKIKNKDAWILTGLYIFFFCGLVFSRYSEHPALFDGENFISKAFYYFSALLLIGFLIYYYFQYHKRQDNSFDLIRFEYLLLFSLFILTLFTARSAVRLIMVLAPIAPIFVGFLIFYLVDKFIKSEDETKRIIYSSLAIVVILLSLFTFWTYYNSVKAQASGMIPSSYNQQWQKAMQWVRENTNEQTTVFAHWWDYGYWVQSIGKRATVLDGGNAIKFWNYLMGRYVLTGDNQDDALEFLYNHNATHLLIDSTDIGKYGAFSSIGSDEDYDRFSWIPAMIYDESQTKETNRGITIVYQGGFGIDEDIVYEQNGTKIFLPAEKTAIIGMVIETIQNNNSIAFEQPQLAFYYQGKQINIPLRYIYFKDQFYDFKTGLEGTADIIPKVDSNGKLNIAGALIYISPRVMRGMLAQKYLLDDPFNNFPNFKLTHTESSLVVESLNSQGTNLGEFIYYGGVQGPIKIWDIEYTGKEKIVEEYLDKDYSKYLSWEL